jgi:hypothetical protein
VAQGFAGDARGCGIRGREAGRAPADGKVSFKGGQREARGDPSKPPGVLTLPGSITVHDRLFGYQFEWAE